jgi:hypothetical protein
MFYGYVGGENNEEARRKLRRVAGIKKRIQQHKSPSFITCNTLL